MTLTRCCAPVPFARWATSGTNAFCRASAICCATTRPLIVAWRRSRLWASSRTERASTACWRSTANSPRQAANAAQQHGKVVLLALSKILNCEEIFAREWRREEKLMGSRLPGLVARLSAALRRHPGKQSGEIAARLSQSEAELASGNTVGAFQALQSLRSVIASSKHADAPIVVRIIDGTRDLATPQRALLVLLCLVVRRVVE